MALPVLLTPWTRIPGVRDEPSTGVASKPPPQRHNSPMAQPCHHRPSDQAGDATLLYGKKQVVEWLINWGEPVPIHRPRVAFWIGVVSPSGIISRPCPSNGVEHTDSSPRKLSIIRVAATRTSSKAWPAFDFTPPQPPMALFLLLPLDSSRRRPSAGT